MLPALGLAVRNPTFAKDSLRTYIPGDSPINTCEVPAPDTDLIVIDELNVTPNPPKRGDTLSIYARGTVLEDITEGAYVDIVVKYGLIRILHQTLDLCEQTDKVDLACPIKEGKVELEREVQLPKVIPNGKYQVTASVFTADGRPVTCLTAVVE